MLWSGVAIALVAFGCGRVGFEDDPSQLADTGPGDIDAGGGDAAGPGELCDAVHNQGLVACFAFDGNAMDLGGGGHHASAANVSFEPGQDGSAIRFGATTMVQIPEASGLDLTEMTVELWLFRDPGGSDDRNLIDNFPQYEVELTAAGTIRARYFINSSNRTLLGTAVLAADQWSHVAVTFDGTRLRIYVDGTEDVSQTFSGSIDTGGDMGTWLGRDHAGGESFSGLFDNLRFFDSARTGGEICAAAGRAAC